MLDLQQTIVSGSLQCSQFLKYVLFIGDAAVASTRASDVLEVLVSRNRKLGKLSRAQTKWCVFGSALDSFNGKKPTAF